MTVQQQISAYLASQPEPKRSDLQHLHRLIRKLALSSKLWFLDGKDADGKTVTNPNIGYGLQTIEYADGKTREFYRVGLSANSTGISVYILGFSDKKYLTKKYAKTIGKASVTGYCIKFRALEQVNLSVLEAALRDGFALKSPASTG